MVQIISDLDSLVIGQALLPMKTSLPSLENPLPFIVRSVPPSPLLLRWENEKISGLMERV